MPSHCWIGRVVTLVIIGCIAIVAALAGALS